MMMCYDYSEVEDLQRSHAYLIDLVERMGIPVFSNIDLALKCTCKTIQQVCMNDLYTGIQAYVGMCEWYLVVVIDHQ